MASTRIASPMRGVTLQLSRLSIRQDASPLKSLHTSFARSISTSTSSQAAVSSITTSADAYVPVKPFAERSVLATIHQFPSLEPLRLESFPANHLYLPTRKDILHRAIVYEGDATRLGTASTKNRYEVHGSARKIRPQKGSGRARLGDKKSPMLRGGGVAHGPRPRDFSSGLQKKVYDLAWRTALSYRFRKGELIIVDNAIEIESPSQRLLNHIFELHERERGRGRSLLVTLESRPLLEQALDKMDRRRQALTWEEVDVKDILELSRIIIERSALENILLAHQEDLTQMPYYKLLTEYAPPAHLESIPGWSEFRTLAAVDPVEREALRPDAYESVSYNRWKHADSLPEGPEKLNLTISAYELLAEAKDLRRQRLPKIEPIEEEAIEKQNRAANLKGKPEAAQAQVDALESELRYRDIAYNGMLLHAQAAEHRADACRWKGQDALADEEYDKARDFRTDVSECEFELYRTKKELAFARATIFTEAGDVKAAEKMQTEGLAMEIQENRARGDMMGGAEDELPIEDSSLLEEQKK